VPAPTAAPPIRNPAQPEKRRRVKNDKIKSKILFIFMFHPPVNLNVVFKAYVIWYCNRY
jgi:hypothetical protein